MQAKKEHLIMFRERFDLTQEQAAKLIGCSRITWNRWENGQHPIPGYFLLTLRGAAAAIRDDYKRRKRA